MIKEYIIIGEETEWPLNGLLTLPEGEGPYPAIVFVHGSGSSDMNSAVYNVKPFKDFADGLAKHNIACIRYDKRTFTHAKRMLKKIGSDFTVWHETIEDAILAANMLKNDPRIDPNKVFIAGLSMGGTLAPRIDEEGGNFAGLIILAGTPRRLEDVMKSQSEDFINSARGIVKWLVKLQAKKLHPKFDNIYTMSDEKAKKKPIAGSINAFYFKDMGKRQVKEYLEATSKPVLVLQGDADFHLSVEKDFNEYQRILKNNPNASFKLYPGLNHVFMPSVHGDIKKMKQEYSKPQNVADYVIDDIAEWVHSQS